MKIGIDASRANRDHKTGTEWYSYYLIKEIIDIDKENDYILYSDKKLSDSFLSDLNLKENKNVKIKVLKWPFKFFWTLARLSLEMLFFKPDILFVPAHTVPFFCPKKTITTIHDVAFVRNKKIYCKELIDIDSSLSRKIINFFVSFFTLGGCKVRSSDYLNWSTKRALRKAKKIISVSRFTKEDILSNYKVDESKVVVIHNGYNDLIYNNLKKENEGDILRKYGVPDNYFLYVGRIEKKKNTYRLIEAFQLFKDNNPGLDIKLVLIGKFGFGSDEVNYLLSEFELHGEVIMPGWVEEVDMSAILRSSKVFIFPSLHEGFGIPVIQALACGVPVLASDIEVLREVAPDSALFFDPMSTEDFYLKLNDLYFSDSMRSEFIGRGLEHAKGFSWRKCAEETLSEIKKL